MRIAAVVLGLAVLLPAVSAAASPRTPRVGLAAPLETLDIHRARDLDGVKLLGKAPGDRPVTRRGRSGGIG